MHEWYAWLCGDMNGRFYSLTCTHTRTLTNSYPHLWFNSSEFTRHSGHKSYIVSETFSLSLHFPTTILEWIRHSNPKCVCTCVCAVTIIIMVSCWFSTIKIALAIVSFKHHVHMQWKVGERERVREREKTIHWKLQNSRESSQWFYRK